MNREAEECILAAAESLSAARDILQREWIAEGRQEHHEATAWWRLNDLVLGLFVLVVRKREDHGPDCGARPECADQCHHLAAGRSACLSPRRRTP